MINCPNCGHDLRVDPQNPQLMICNACGYILGMQTGPVQQMQAQQMPMQQAIPLQYQQIQPQMQPQVQYQQPQVQPQFQQVQQAQQAQPQIQPQVQYQQPQMQQQVPVAYQQQIRPQAQMQPQMQPQPQPMPQPQPQQAPAVFVPITPATSQPVNMQAGAPVMRSEGCGASERSMPGVSAAQVAPATTAAQVTPFQSVNTQAGAPVMRSEGCGASERSMPGMPVEQVVNMQAGAPVMRSEGCEASERSMPGAAAAQAAPATTPEQPASTQADDRDMRSEGCGASERSMSGSSANQADQAASASQQKSTKAAAYDAPKAKQAQPKVLPRGLAIAALALSIVAIVNCWIPFINVISIVLGVLALIFGIVAVARANSGKAGGRGMGIAGIIMSILAVVLALLVNVFFVKAIDVVLSDEEVRAELSQFIDEIEDTYGLYGRVDGIVATDADSTSTSASSTGRAPFNDNGAWTSLKFTMQGNEFVLLQTTLADFEAKTGWKINAAELGLSEGYVVQRGEEISISDLTSSAYPNIELELQIANISNGQCDLADCVLIGIVYADYNEQTQGDVFGIDGGAAIGGSIQDALKTYGTPTYDYGATGSDYRAISYETSDYMKELEIIASNGTVIDYIALQAS